MERFEITVVRDKEIMRFQVADYLHQEGEHCKFEVYNNGDFIASFQPDAHQFLHVCKNPGKLDEEVLHLIADQLELLPHDGRRDDTELLKDQD
ncbi:hypothetical protein MUY27_05520 [Mucilaginibacter sp. RS28]|uniref:Uncharacterized protein n=1 Tax=Mucilaginibacter straminoryzae TaxID=2932774 RepID=A0A9X1X0T9_9SPHI|nr:hypothetical protein [Mucilaginibacter straminoryzae]MCJ8209157.1 hypothetical protein [Mucilaginibacter straminoryzae]